MLFATPQRKFWAWQAGFWFFVSMTSFFTLTLWYGPFTWMHILQIAIQGTAGLVLSLMLYWVFKTIWNESTTFRLIVGLVAVMAVAVIWTFARMEVFVLLTGQIEEWDEFGGWHFTSIFIFLCWAGLFHGIRYYELLQAEHRVMLLVEAEARDEQVKRMKAQTVARDAQIKMLRYQLNPHFLCNTLNAINSLVESQESVKAQKMTVNLSRFLRYSLDYNPDTKLALENEIMALNLYLDIERTRFGDRLKIDFQIDEEAKIGKIPSLLLQPIIENSMKHAIALSEEGGVIGLIASVQSDQLVLELFDSGSGIKKAPTKIMSSKGRGVGLRNIGERLKALYGSNYVFDLDVTAAGGLKTTIKIPYEPQQKINKSLSTEKIFTG